MGCNVFDNVAIYILRFSGVARPKFEEKAVFKRKILWRRKYVRREIFRTVEVRVEGGLSPVHPLLCLQHVQLCHCVNFQGSSYTKNKYSLFYQKFDNFFEKCYIRKKLYIKKSILTLRIGNQGPLKRKTWPPPPPPLTPFWSWGC